MNAHKRDPAIEAFLAANGWADARRKPLAGDASFRTYQRLHLNGESLVLMDAPPAHEDVRRFIALADYLRSLGLSAPKVLARDIEAGLLVLEDLGDDTYTRVLNLNPGMTETLYEKAVRVLIRLHQTALPGTLKVKEGENFRLPDYDQDLLFQELFLFSDWYLPALLGGGAETWQRDLKKIWQPLLARALANPPCLTLRDYHADNLMWLPGRPGVRQVGLLDFQDAVRGHPAYDLVSLLQDARRPFDAGLEKKMIEFYLEGMGKTDTREEFLEVYEILGAQRNMKIIGIFTRLWKRDGKADYPKMIPHVWTLLEKNLIHPSLAEVKDWINLVAPKGGRGL